MSEIAIKAENVSKVYRIGAVQKKYRTMRETLVEAVQGPFQRAARVFRGQASGAAGLNETVHALRDVSFEVRQGEVLGIIGRNGAGKSTLLKIFSKITRPSEGTVRLWGRVGSLLEVGTGFHQELTGRENIFLNGAILGMKRAEIDRKFDEIVAFSETEKFLDTPVKHYSSGMKVRLAFAVAAHLEPEILIIDEVLAVGDIAFQKKCLGRMGDVARSGRTILFVSHNMAAVSSLCTRGMLLSGGSVVQSGDTSDVITGYLKSLSTDKDIPLDSRTDRGGDGRLRFTDVKFLDDTGSHVPSAVSGKALTVLLSYVTSDGQPARNIDMDLAFYGALGQLLFFCKVQLARGQFEVVPPKGAVACHIPNFPLSPGRYRFKLWCQANYTVADKLEDAGELLVEAGDFFGTGNLPTKNPEGIVMVQHRWQLMPNGNGASGHSASELAGVIDGIRSDRARD